MHHMVTLYYWDCAAYVLPGAEFSDILYDFVLTQL